MICPSITMTFASTSTTCFVEGLLHSVPHEHADALSKTWVGIGVRTDPVEDRSRRLSKLIESLQASIPAEDAKHTEWFHFARGWAELILLMNEQAEPFHGEDTQTLKSLQTQVDAGFTTWLFKRYAGLVNLPPVPPVMLHHLPRFLARQLEKTATQDRTDRGGRSFPGPMAGRP